MLLFETAVPSSGLGLEDPAVHAKRTNDDKVATGAIEDSDMKILDGRLTVPGVEIVELKSYDNTGQGGFGLGNMKSW